MKRPLLIGLLCLSALIMSQPLASSTPKPDKPVTTKTTLKSNKSSAAKAGDHKSFPSDLNILQLTNAQMYRYGREMYLSKNYTEAARAFLEILRNDCGSKVAQYHLRKIAAKDPSLAFLNDKLNKLPCKSYDFTKEDFLPASVYYEKDPDLILEQMISYNTRHRLTEKEMGEKIDTYTVMVRDLEATVEHLKQNATEMEAKTSAGTVDKDTIARIEEGKKYANKIEKEINVLKNQLASERLDRQKEVQDMRTRVAEAEAHLLTDNDQPQKNQPAAAALELKKSPAPAETHYSDNAKALLEAVAQAKIELAGKERSLAQKDQALMTLQARFDDIQRRLKAIQNDLANKNAQIQAIQLNIQDTQKP